VISIRARFGAPPPAPAVATYLRALYPYLDLRLGTRCNFNCRYCLVGDEKRLTRPVSDVVHELELGRRCGLLRVALTGGEPMLHPGLLEIVERARGLGYQRIILVTNASLLGESGNLRRLRAAGVDAFGFSFDVPDPRLAEYLWRNPAYPEVLRGIENLMAEPEVIVGSIAVITRPTQRRLPDLARFLADVAKARRGRFLPNLDFVMPEENAWNERHALVPRLSEAAPLVREALDVAAARGLTLTYRGLPACIMGDRHLDRDMDRFMSIFQVHEVFGEFAFNRTALDLFRTKAPVCRQCRHDRWCFGVFRSYAHLHGLDELVPVRRQSA
jgi:MoaA/NifB/PqqE/SkfB family radical SAM enzyme